MLELSAEERRTCREALRNLLGKVYQPIVIKELLFLQGGPKQVCMCMFDEEIIVGTAATLNPPSGVNVVVAQCEYKNPEWRNSDNNDVYMYDRHRDGYICGRMKFIQDRDKFPTFLNT